MYESYDVSTVDIQTGGNSILRNLALGTFKEMVGISGQNLEMPGTFTLASGANTVVGNVAAGSERVGYMLAGPACGSGASLFRDNSVHSSIVGVWLKSSSASRCERASDLVCFRSMRHCAARMCCPISCSGPPVCSRFFPSSPSSPSSLPPGPPAAPR